MNDLEFLVPIALFVSLAAVFILRGPIGRALADRLAGRAGPGPAAVSDATAPELDDLRRRVEELEERLDFAERRLVGERTEPVPRGRIGERG
jgi:hypothetical protein